MKTSVFFLLSLIAILSHAIQDKPGLVDKLFQQWNKPGSPGASVGIIQNGKFLYKRGYGMAELTFGVPITPETLTIVGSVSKQFTAMCIALLIEDGKISLYDDIRKYVPEMPVYDVTRPIRISDIVYHTSGLRDYLFVAALAGHSEYFDLEDRIVFDIITRQKKLNHPTGKDFLYTNSGYFLQKVIVERVSGMPLHVFAKKRIFEPLQMHKTQFVVDSKEIIPNFATAYASNNRGGFRKNQRISSLIGSGGLATTQDDFLKYDQNFYNNKLGRGSQNLIRFISTPGKFDNGTSVGYAFGLRVDGDILHHGGSSEGYRAYMLRVVPKNFTVFIQGNVAEMNVGALATEIAKIYLGTPIHLSNKKAPESVKSDMPTKVSNELLKEYVGYYFSMEAGTVWNITLGEGVLQFHLAPFGLVKFVVKDDRFSVADFAKGIVTRRDGKVVGFVIDTDRAKGIEFTKTDVPPIGCYYT